VFTGAAIGAATGMTAGCLTGAVPGSVAGGGALLVEEQAARKSAAIALARSKDFINPPMNSSFSLREKVARSAG
jgi:outer membrane lipoprotein SlyB